MNILDAIVACDYLINSRDQIISIFYDAFMGKKSNIFITFKFNPNSQNFEKILVVRYFISIMLNTRVYEVPVLIYFPKMFPAEAPEIYVEKNEEIGVNPKSTIVDRTNLRVHIASLRNWNMANSNLNSVFIELSTEFSKCFPVYRLEAKEHGKSNYGENCILLKDNLQSVNFDAPSRLDKHHFSNYNHNRGNSQPLISLDEFNNYSGKNVKNVNNSNPQFEIQSEKLPTYSDDQLKRIYIKEMVSSIFPKVKSEQNNLKSHEDKLNAFKSECLSKIEKVKNLAERKEEITNKISTLSHGIQMQVQDLQNYINLNSQLDFSMNLENLDKFLSISDADILKTVSAECVLEDLLVIIKKAFEKRIPGFDLNYTIKLIRKFSREIYTIKFYKDKLIYLHGIRNK